MVSRADTNTMARVLYMAVMAFRARQPINFAKLDPDTRVAYLTAARIVLTHDKIQ